MTKKTDIPSTQNKLSATTKKAAAKSSPKVTASVSPTSPTRKLVAVSSPSLSLRPSSQASSQEDMVANVRSDSSLPLPLSFKEKNVLEFLEAYLADKGVSPTYQEICGHFGFASFNSVQRYLKQLEAKGYIRMPWSNQKRAITLVHPASSLQAAVLESRDDGYTSPLESLTPALLPSESLSLPLLGRVAAGAPIEAVEHDEFIEVPASLVRHADRTYALRVQGQSMIDDGILDGDVILVQRQSTAQNGEIVVAMIGEEATVKRFYSHRGTKNIPAEAIEALSHRMATSDLSENSSEGDDVDGENGGNSHDETKTRVIDKLIELRPANSSMSPMWFDPSELQIRGVVVGLIRRFM